MRGSSRPRGWEGRGAGGVGRLLPPRERFAVESLQREGGEGRTGARRGAGPPLRRCGVLKGFGDSSLSDHHRGDPASLKGGKRPPSPSPAAILTSAPNGGGRRCGGFYSRGGPAHCRLRRMRVSSRRPSAAADWLTTPMKPRPLLLTLSVPAPTLPLQLRFLKPNPAPPPPARPLFKPLSAVLNELLHTTTLPKPHSRPFKSTPIKPRPLTHSPPLPTASSPQTTPSKTKPRPFLEATPILLAPPLSATSF